MGVDLSSVGMIQLLSVFGHMIYTGSGSSVPIDKSFVLEYLVVEELPPETLIGSVPRDYQLNRKYSSTTLSELRFRFLSRPGVGDRVLFAVDENSGVLQTAERIDREEICPGTSECFVAFDLAVHPMIYFQIIKIRIEIVDVNDNSPVFPQPSVSLELSEASDRGATLPLPNAVDFDAGKNGACEYHLSPPENHFLLQVTPSTADASGKLSDGCAVRLRLVLAEGLDRETTERFRFSVIAVDLGQPVRRSGSLLVELVVLDANDHAPTFDQSPYSASVTEDTSPGQPLLQVNAVDQDSGLNGKVRYTFVGRTLAEHGDVFRLDADTGVVSTRRWLDYEVRSFYRLFIAANDLGDIYGGARLTSHTMVEITVKDVNDNAPQICLRPWRQRSTANISHLTGSHPESVAVSNFSMMNECQNAASLVVTAQTVDDNSSFVAHATITDADSGDNGRFDCSLHGRSASKFTLRRLYATEFVIVTAAGSINAAELESVGGGPDSPGRRVVGNFTLVCRDHGDPQLTSLINVGVELFEKNWHAPVFASNLYHASIAENNEVGVLLTRVEATDADRHGNRVRYRFDDLLTAQLLAIDAWTGVVTAAVSFDRELMSTIEVTVVAQDSGSPSLSASARLIVTVRDVNDERPRFQTNHYTFRVAENLPTGTLVGEVTAMDRDTFSFNRIVYSLDPVSDQVFSIDSDTGRLVTRRPLDREERASYRAVVVARPPTKDAHVTDDTFASEPEVCDVDIVVDDVNDSRPRFQFPIAGNDTIVVRAADSGIGHVVGQVHASDDDVGVNAQLVYRLSTQSVATLLPPSTTTNAFRIDALSGKLTTIVDLRGAAHRDAPTAFILEVIVSDRGSPSLSNSAPLRVVVGSKVVGLHKTNAQEDRAVENWEGGAVAELLALSKDELMLIVAFILSAIFVSICIVVVCTSRCGRKRCDKRSAGPQQEVVGIGDALIDSPLMMTSLTSDSMTTPDIQVKSHVRCNSSILSRSLGVHISYRRRATEIRQTKS